MAKLIDLLLEHLWQIFLGHAKFLGQETAHAAKRLQDVWVLVLVQHQIHAHQARKGLAARRVQVLVDHVENKTQQM